MGPAQRRSALRGRFRRVVSRRVLTAVRTTATQARRDRRAVTRVRHRSIPRVERRPRIPAANAAKRGWCALATAAPRRAPRVRSAGLAARHVHTAEATASSAQAARHLVQRVRRDSSLPVARRTAQRARRVLLAPRGWLATARANPRPALLGNTALAATTRAWNAVSTISTVGPARAAAPRALGVRIAHWEALKRAKDAHSVPQDRSVRGEASRRSVLLASSVGQGVPTVHRAASTLPGAAQGLANAPRARRVVSPVAARSSRGSSAACARVGGHAPEEAQRPCAQLGRSVRAEPSHAQAVARTTAIRKTKQVSAVPVALARSRLVVRT